MLIVGLGDIGTMLAKLCKKQGWIVYGIRNHIPSEPPEYAEKIVRLSEVGSLLSDVDYVVNLLPESDSTKGIFNYSFFKQLKPTACFCNVGRGSAVVNDDLEKAVNSGMLQGGVILDASTKKRFHSKRILLTDHYSWKTTETDELIHEFYSLQLKRFIDKGNPENVLQLK